MNRFKLLVTRDNKIFTIITYCWGSGGWTGVCDARSRPAVFISDENRPLHKWKTKLCDNSVVFTIYISCRSRRRIVWNQPDYRFYSLPRSLENGIIIYDIIHLTRTFNYAHFSTTTSVRLNAIKPYKKSVTFFHYYNDRTRMALNDD